MRYVRTVKTASGATAVQIVCSFHRGSRDIEHIGSAHDDAELELLKAVARQRLAAGQGLRGLHRRTRGAPDPPRSGSGSRASSTLKGQLTLEDHGGRTLTGVYARVAARLLALATAIWHNWRTGTPVKRSLVAYDH